LSVQIPLRARFRKRAIPFPSQGNHSESRDTEEYYSGWLLGRKTFHCAWEMNQIVSLKSGVRWRFEERSVAHYRCGVHGCWMMVAGVFEMVGQRRLGISELILWGVGTTSWFELLWKWECYWGQKRSLEMILNWKFYMLCNGTKMEVKLTTPTETSVSHIPVSFRGQDKIYVTWMETRRPTQTPPFFRRAHSPKTKIDLLCDHQVMKLLPGE